MKRSLFIAALQTVVFGLGYLTMHYADKGYAGAAGLCAVAAAIILAAVVTMTAKSIPTEGDRHGN